MVKGISRRVIVIKTPDPRIFDEAIFIVRDDAVRKGITQAEIVKEAQAVAASYLKNNRRKTRKRGFATPLVAASGGAVAATLVWLAVQLLSNL